MRVFRFGLGLLVVAALLLLTGCGRAGGRVLGAFEGAALRGASTVVAEGLGASGRAASRVGSHLPDVPLTAPHYTAPAPVSAEAHPTGSGSSLGETVTEKVIDFAGEAAGSASDDQRDDTTRK